jgi:cytochrome P450
MRYATEDTVIANTPIAAGEAVAVWIGSANRDGAVVAHPERFDISRHPNRHIAFGFGPHFCVGAPLARIALRLLFDELCQLVEGFEVTGPVRRLRSNFAAGFTHLPVRTRLRLG